MKTVTMVALIIVSIAIIGIVVSMDLFRFNTNAVIRLSVTAQTTPENIKIHTQEQLANIDSNTIILDNATLDKIPILKNAIDQALSRFVPPPLHGIHTFTTQISQDDANSIMELAGNKVNQLPETETSDVNFGVNFTENSSNMDFKFDNFYYHVVIDHITLSQGK